MTDTQSNAQQESQDSFKSEDSNLSQNLVEQLSLEKKRLVGRRRRIAISQTVFIAMSISMPLIVLAIFPLVISLDKSPSKSGIGIFGAIALSVAYTAIPLTFLARNRIDSRELETSIQEIDFQIDIQTTDVSRIEMRAEKILRLNDLQLRRYYDLNLNQNSWVFVIGISCILLGVGIIGAALYIVLKTEESETKIIVAVLGAIGAILTNYIAAIYLKMSASANDSLKSFHARLADTHQILLGNLLVSRISNEEKRWDALAQLSIQLSSNKNGTSENP